MISQGHVEAAVETASTPRRILLVRITHWIVVLSVLGLLVSGAGLLVYQPRLYWGETGNVATPSLVDLPKLNWTTSDVTWRAIHFFSAWVLVLTGLTYVIGGFITRHIRKDLLPTKADLHWKRIAGIVWDSLRWKHPEDDGASSYNVVQRLTYLAVVFGLFPAILWTGLAMSFAITSVFPIFATALGGFQSARTLHFACTVLLVLFLVVHLLMVYLAGFWRSMWMMITGYAPQEGRTR
jgi:thiosulfate reductase cytochrome b subunit